MTDELSIKELSLVVEAQIKTVFECKMTGLAPREDSRSFGGFIQKQITDNLAQICAGIGCEPEKLPGKKSLFDFAFRMNGRRVGVDIKTKDADKGAFSDGGICTVENVLKFLANENGIFLVAEIGHVRASTDSLLRDIKYIHVAPFIGFPFDSYRIANLGTGQIRSSSLAVMLEKIEWERTCSEFCREFADKIEEHYKKVSRDANERLQKIKQFKENGYRNF
ncbi:MAG: hypothetical protein LBR07_08170 [Puniceicoccales bacterium]|jgi:hypothetical protein|nr:hypothetical protein [Puniceicoccales bacterium]